MHTYESNVADLTEEDEEDEDEKMKIMPCNFVQAIFQMKGNLQSLNPDFETLESYMYEELH